MKMSIVNVIKLIANLDEVVKFPFNFFIPKKNEKIGEKRKNRKSPSILMEVVGKIKNDIFFWLLVGNWMISLILEAGYEKKTQSINSQKN